MDLVSFNMQRGREFGIPSYMEFRFVAGILFGTLPAKKIDKSSYIELNKFNLIHQVEKILPSSV